MRSIALPLIALLAGCALLPPTTPAPGATPPRAGGEPAAELLSEGGVVVQLYQEPCQLAAVENLPYRATWREARGNFEGCFDVQHQSIVVLYFEDHTVVTLPLAQFGPPAAPEPEKPRPISL